MSSSDPSAPGAVPELLGRLQSEISSLFHRQGISETEARTILDETVAALVYKWNGITDHEYWLIKALENRCRSLSHRRREGEERRPAG